MDTPVSHWSDPAIISLVGLTATTFIGVLVGGIIKIIEKLSEIKTQNEKQTESLQAVGTDAKVIAGHVNSEKSISEGEKLALKVEIRLLREQLADEKIAKQLLAQAAALVPALAVVPGLPPSPAAADAPVLNKIESNTQETAANTKRTEAVVTDLKAKT